MNSQLTKKRTHAGTASHVSGAATNDALYAEKKMLVKINVKLPKDKKKDRQVSFG